MEITKQEAQSLQMTMQNAELNVKGATVIYSLQAAASNKIARASIKVRETKYCSHWFYSETRREYQSKL